MREAESAFLLVLLYHLPELFLDLNIDPVKKEVFALATAETCYSATVIFGFVRIAFSEHLRTVVVSDSVRTVVTFAAAIVVASDLVTPVVASDYATTAVASAASIVGASDHGKNVVVSGQLTVFSGFARTLVCQSLRDGASRICYSSSELDHSNPWKDTYQELDSYLEAFGWFC